MNVHVSTINPKSCVRWKPIGCSAAFVCEVGCGGPFSPPPVRGRSAVLIRNCCRPRKQIRPIKDKRRARIAFRKRKNGLFKKAIELSVLCRCKIAIVALDDRDRLYTYASEGSVGAVLDRVKHAQRVHEECSNSWYERLGGDPLERHSSSSDNEGAGEDVLENDTPAGTSAPPTSSTHRHDNGGAAPRDVGEASAPHPGANVSNNSSAELRTTPTGGASVVPLSTVGSQKSGSAFVRLSHGNVASVGAPLMASGAELGEFHAGDPFSRFPPSDSFSHGWLPGHVPISTLPYPNQPLYPGINHAYPGDEQQMARYPIPLAPSPPWPPVPLAAAAPIRAPQAPRQDNPGSSQRIAPANQE